METKKVRVLLKSEYGHLEANAWIPDETKLVFYANSSHDYKDGLWIADVNKVDTPELLFEEGGNIAWSSINIQAVSRKSHSNILSIVIRDALTGEEKIVFREPGIAIGGVTWSTDGSTLGFQLDHGEFRSRDIYIFQMKTWETNKITSAGTNDSPALSPDGNLVAYVKGDFTGANPAYRLHIMKSDGTCDIEVPGMVDVGSPAWSPDGRYIAFVGQGNRIFQLDLFSTFGEGFLVSGPPCQ